jgi:hypothetical protein
MRRPPARLTNVEHDVICRQSPATFRKALLDREGADVATVPQDRIDGVNRVVTELADRVNELERMLRRREENYVALHLLGNIPVRVRDADMWSVYLTAPTTCMPVSGSREDHPWIWELSHFTKT